MPLLPVDHLGATMGAVIPFWDQRDEFGDTDLIVAKPEEGQSLARALGANWVVLMRRHGATVVGVSMEEMVFRSVFSCRNAEMQREAQTLGGIRELTPLEIQKAGAFNLEPRPIARAWEYWTTPAAQGRSGVTRRAVSGSFASMADTPSETPVLIAGGGPIGLALAADLGRRGVATLLVEERENKLNPAKMLEVSVRTMEFCRQLGIVEKVRNWGFPADWSLDSVFVTDLQGYELGRVRVPALEEQAHLPVSPERECHARRPGSIRSCRTTRGRFRT